MSTPEETPTIRMTSTSARAQLTPGTILGDRYRIVSLVGRGGMGAVYRADDLRVGQTIAIKFLTHAAAHARELYEEVRIGRQITHPNICRLYDVADVDGQIFITMEFVDGEDLASLLRRVGRLTTSKAMGVARDLCAGLAAAHELGVIHRDMKPGNVMLDGRGRGRITDFGLAVAETSADGALLAGTPAYMAPEQLAGQRTTMRSDIYALGLVLYEVFTGRRAIESGTLSQIVAQQREARFAPPSEFARDIDPAIERMILRCLDPNPEARPESVASMIRDLPDFDPLAAAVAAGETPTPAMVAASLRRGDLRAPVALALLGVALATILAVAALASRTTVLGKAPPKPPEVLRERASEILDAAGASAPVVDSGQSFYLDRDHSRLFFVERRSPVPMLPLSTDRRLTDDDPPLNVPGMTRVTLDGRGRLLEMIIVPPRRTDALTRGGVAAEPLLPFTGIPSAALHVAPTAWTAPVDTDAKRAWLTGEGTRIEVASYFGRPVWLAVIEPAPEQQPKMTRVAFGAFMFLLILVPAAMVILAWNNYRRRTGDRRGALRVAAVFFVAFALALLVRAHHPGTAVAEWLVVCLVTMIAAFIAANLGIFYFASEPFVRRRWPDMLISWSRLLAGQWRDAMVGRDVLIGCIAGASVILIAQLLVLGAGKGSLATYATPLSSVWQWLYYVLRNFSEAVFRGVTVPALLLVVRAIVRRVDVALTICAVVFALALIDEIDGALPLAITFGIVTGALTCFIVYRFGMLALAASAFTALTLQRLPLTLDSSSWYFGRSLLALALIAALAGYGFWLAAGGRRALRVHVEM